MYILARLLPTLVLTSQEGESLKSHTLQFDSRAIYASIFVAVRLNGVWCLRFASPIRELFVGIAYGPWLDVLLLVEFRSQKCSIL